MNKVNAKKGFTLIELLIVIGILAVLATVTLLVLNPAQMFAQARDSQRISDLNSIKSAIALYLSTVSSPALGTIGETDYCATYYWGTMATSSSAAALWGTGNLHVTWKDASATTTVGTTGWIPVALGSTPGGSPLSTLPMDPTNFVVSLNSNQTQTAAYYYACSTTQTTFKLVGNMESQRYAKDGTDDKESTDGGTNAAYYETGTDISAGL